jgi:hypothetical protein
MKNNEMEKKIIFCLFHLLRMPASLNLVLQCLKNLGLIITLLFQTILDKFSIQFRI